MRLWEGRQTCSDKLPRTSRSSLTRTGSASRSCSKDLRPLGGGRGCGLGLCGPGLRVDRLLGHELGPGEEPPLRHGGPVFEESVARTNARSRYMRSLRRAGGRRQCVRPPVQSLQTGPCKARFSEQPQRLGLLLVCPSLGDAGLRRPLRTPGLTPGRGSGSRVSRIPGFVFPLGSRPFDHRRDLLGQA